MSRQPLFGRESLRDYLARVQQRAEQALLDYPADQLLQAAEADVIDYLLDLALVEKLVLHREQAYLLEPSEHTLTNREAYDLTVGGAGRRITRWTLVVPFTGDHELFSLRASTYGLNPPLADLQPNDIHFVWESHYGSGAPDQIRANFEGQIQSIEHQLGLTNKDVREHNDRVQNEIPGAVRKRRAKHLADRQTQAALGFPVKRRGDAATYSVPVSRRPIRPARTAQRPGPVGRTFTPDSWRRSARWIDSMAPSRQRPILTPCIWPPICHRPRTRRPTSPRLGRRTRFAATGRIGWSSPRSRFALTAARAENHRWAAFRRGLAVLGLNTADLTVKGAQLRSASLRDSPGGLPLTTGHQAQQQHGRPA